MRRRTFLQAGAGCAAAAWLGGRPIEAAGDAKTLKILSPFHGAVLNRRHGEACCGGLKIHVLGQAPPDWRVTVNGTPAVRSGANFDAAIDLRDKETDLVAVGEGNGRRGEDRVRVVWDRNSFPRYRFSIDDNSFFLRDVAQKKYASLFDCFYLDTLRKLHKKYGAKFVLNIYYTTADGFDITQFPDRYKPEWKDNADWLRLAFHAWADKPDRPYQEAAPEKLTADFDKVAEQIRRFAGEPTYTPPTVIHWGMVRPAALKPLYERGVRVLSGFFRKNAQGRYDVNYEIDDARSEYLSTHDALKDFGSGIVFSTVDIVCNNVPVEKTVPTLAPLTKDPNTAEIMDLFTHEQYFWPFYRNYVPDHAQRLDAAIRFATEQGYKPVFYHEGFLGAPE
jgi:hypothetical protein